MANFNGMYEAIPPVKSMGSQGSPCGPTGIWVQPGPHIELEHHMGQPQSLSQMWDPLGFEFGVMT